MLKKCRYYKVQNTGLQSQQSHRNMHKSHKGLIKAVFRKSCIEEADGAVDWGERGICMALRAHGSHPDGLTILVEDAKFSISSWVTHTFPEDCTEIEPHVKYTQIVNLNIVS